MVWTINDSGNEAILYGIDTVSGNLVREVHIVGAENTDWEAITQDENNIYIADNGNNFRTRHNYKIYVISKDSISKEREQKIIPHHQITYNFRDSDLAKIELDKTRVDSEAILVDGDSLLVYIKDWLYSQLSVFSLPYKESNVKCTLGSTYEIGFAVTAATRINESQIAFLGYRDYRSFLTILETNPQLTGDVVELAHYELFDLQGFQTEGITYKDGKIFISCENQIIEQTLFQVEFK